MDIPQKKFELRAAIRTRIASLSEKERAAESRTLCRTLLTLLSEDVRVLAAYMSLPDELDLRPLLEEYLAKGKKVFLPRFENGGLVFREVKDLGVLSRGALNILEPPVTAPLLKPAELTHVLVPGRAFDRSGNRLGRGNGGYDLWIPKQREKNPHTVFYGVCFECQLVSEVPVEAHDARMDAVVTARGKAQV